MAQGAIGIACRDGDDAAAALIAALNHEETRVAVLAERAFLAALDGSCRTPIAGLARRSADGSLSFRGLIASPDGKQCFEVACTGTFDPEDAVRVGRDAGEQLKADAGPAFFDALGLGAGAGSAWAA